MERKGTMERGPVAKDLRLRNRARVLRHMLLTAETTRAHIAQECGISLASAANVVGDLLAEGLVRENGYLPSEGGRPKASLSVVSDAAYAIGVAVGEHGVSVGLFDLGFTPIDRVFNRVHERMGDPRPTAAAVLEGVATMRSRHPEMERRLLGIGLGMPGIVDLDDHRGPVIYAQSLGWPPVLVAELFAETNLRVYADNGAKTQAMSEVWFGAARGVEHGIVALLGRGIGVGVVSGGMLLRGATSSAGEWGHTKMSLGGPQCRCGAHGCLEAYVGGEAIAASWRAVGGPPQGDEEEAVASLLVASSEGDEAAQKVLADALDVLGVALSNLVNLYNPQRIVIGGWLGQALASDHLGLLAERVRASSLDRPGSEVDLVPSKLGADSVALGAALLPFQRLIDADPEVAFSDAG